MLAALSLPISAGAAAKPCPGQAGAVICTLHEAAGEDGTIKGRAEAATLLKALLTDGKISPSEKKLVEMLIAIEPDATLPYMAKNGNRHEYGAPDDEAQYIIKLLYGPNMDKAFADDAGELSRLVDYANLPVPTMKNIARKNCAGWLQKRWTGSNITNVYKPYRERIGGLSKRLSELPDAAQHAPGRAFLYKCANMHDKALRDTVPDYLYSWLKQPVSKP